MGAESSKPATESIAQVPEGAESTKKAAESSEERARPKAAESPKEGERPKAAESPEKVAEPPKLTAAEGDWEDNADDWEDKLELTTRSKPSVPDKSAVRC